MEHFLKVEDAARLMRCSTQTIKIGLQTERLPIGCAVYNREWRYIIPWKKFTEFTGISPVEKEESNGT